MEIEVIKSKMMDQNCYLIKNDKGAILIDPGMNTEIIRNSIENENVEFILLTHCHFDHIYSVKRIKENKKVVASEKCSKNVCDLSMVLGKNKTILGDFCDITMSDGEEMNFSGIKVKCIHTPGHTEDSVCYLIENNLFSGDTLFFESVGRWDFKTGSFSELEKSIKNKIYTLPDDTKIFAGHGNPTTVGYEKINNPYIKG